MRLFIKKAIMAKYQNIFAIPKIKADKKHRPPRIQDYNYSQILRQMFAQKQADAHYNEGYQAAHQKYRGEIKFMQPFIEELRIKADERDNIIAETQDYKDRFEILQEQSESDRQYIEGLEGNIDFSTTVIGKGKEKQKELAQTVEQTKGVITEREQQIAEQRLAEDKRKLDNMINGLSKGTFVAIIKKYNGTVESISDKTRANVLRMLLQRYPKLISNDPNPDVDLMKFFPNQLDIFGNETPTFIDSALDVHHSRTGLRSRGQPKTPREIESISIHKSTGGAHKAPKVETLTYLNLTPPKASSKK